MHAFLLTGLVAAIYSNTLDVPFVFDDIFYVGANPSLRNLGAWVDAKGWADPRFLSYLTFALEGSLHGGSLAGMHVTNSLVHACTTLLVYALVRALFRSPTIIGTRIGAAGPLVALGAAALFAAHPVQTQAVTYVMQRMASLAACLYLASTLAYVRTRLSPTLPSRVAWLAASAAALVAGLLTKQNVATLPAILVLIELCFFDGPIRRRLLWLAPHWALTGSVAAVWLGAATSAATVGVESRRLGSAAGPLEYCFTQARVLVEYLKMLAVPTGQNIDHAFAVSRSIREPAVLGSFLLLAALALTGLWLLVTATRRDPAWRLVGFGVAWWFVTHAVESSFIPISDVMVEHRVYLPAAGIFVALSTITALGFQVVSSRSGRAALIPAISFVVAVLVLAVAARSRNEVWRSGARLWRDAATKSPHNARAHSNLGAHLLVAGDATSAITAYATAVRVDPTYAPAHWGLSQAYAAAGQTELSERYRAEAFRLGAEHQLRLGEELMAAGSWRSAIGELERGVRGAPFDPRMRRALGLAYLGAGEAGKAVAELQRARDLAPSAAETHLALARALREVGRTKEARAAEAEADRIASGSDSETR